MRYLTVMLDVVLTVLLMFPALTAAEIKTALHSRTLNTDAKTGIQFSLAEMKFNDSSFPRNMADVTDSFSGFHNGAIIFAGGRSDVGHSNIATGRIIVFAKEADGQRWQYVETNQKLPCALMKGVSVSTSLGLVCIGGTDGKQLSNKVFLLAWDSNQRKILISNLPSLPFGIYNASGCMFRDKIYLIGGLSDERQQTHIFLSLDLLRSDSKYAWRQLPSWKGANRILPLIIAQSDGFGDCLYLFGGYSIKGGLLSDAYKYNFQTSSWKKISDTVTFDKKEISLSSKCPAIVFGDSHIFIFNIFNSRILNYHTITDTWTSNGVIPLRFKCANVGKIDKKIIIYGLSKQTRASNQEKNAKLSGYVVKFIRKYRPFGLLNVLALIAYLLTLVAMGVFFSGREKSTEDFFIGGHRVPWWAAGISIFGTQLSSISFMAIPAKVYMSDWLYYVAVFCIVAIQPIIVWYYLPFFRRLNVTTAYEYLEKRFNIAARLFGSLSFILFQCGRMTIVLFLPALALSAVTGMNIYICIFIMGTLATFYTVLGGIEAVIWTDVLQVCVLVGGALLSLAIIIMKCGGIGQIISVAGSAGKFRMIALGWDWTLPVLWVVVVGNLFSNLMSYSADQAVVQRYLTTKDEKTAARAIWTNAAITIPISLIWFFLGTALFVFYKFHPNTLDPTLKNDQIFPLFIAQQLPNGVVGLVIAGLFAAAMSTVDSSLNSISTAITTDFYRRFRADASERHYLVLARVLTIIFGIIATGMGLWMAANQEAIKSLWDMYMKILGLVMGGLTGLFVLGIFTRRANGVGALIGAITSACLLWVVQTYTHIHFFLYSAIGIISCVLIGYIVSLILPTREKSIAGLTYYTLQNH